MINRNKPIRLQHDDYVLNVLTDCNKAIVPLYRVQSITIDEDFTTESLQEIGNPGYVQIKEDTPTVGVTMGGNIISQEINSRQPLYWLSAVANGDTVGDDAKEVVNIGSFINFQNGEIHCPGVSPIGSSLDCSFDKVIAADVSKIGAIFWTQEAISVKSISFKMKKTGTPANTAKVRVGLQTAPAGAITNAIIWATQYSLSDATTSETRWLATTDGIDSDNLTTDYTRQFQAYFDTPVKLIGNIQYAIVWEIYDATGYAYVTNLIDIAARGTNVIGGNAAKYYTGAWHAIATTYDIWFSLGLYTTTKEFDYYLSGDDDQAISGTYGLENTVGIPSTVDLLLPIKGISELSRVFYYGQCSVTSLNFTFNVDGVSTFEVGMEADNRSLFAGDRKEVEVRSIEVCLYSTDDNANVNTTITLNGVASVPSDTVNFPTGTTYTQVYQVYLNGEELEQATTGSELNALGVTKWAKPDSSTNQIAFTVNTIIENDVIRVVYLPSSVPSWSTYQLVSDVGEQGGINKGEMVIRLITDTTLPRVVEGLEVADAGEVGYYELDVSPGACYLVMDDACFDPALVNTYTSSMELYRLTVPQVLLLGTPVISLGSVINDTDVMALGSITITMVSGAPFKIGQHVKIVDEDTADNWALGNVTNVVGNDVTLNIYRLTAAFTLNNLATTDEAFIVSRALVARVNRYGEMVLSVTDDDETTIKTREQDVNADELYLALVVLGHAMGANNNAVYSVTDKREFHINTFSLLQSTTYATDLSREAVYEIGNSRAVARTLNTPVPTTVDFTVKDADNEIYILIHESRTVLSIARDETNNNFTSTSATSNALFTTDVKAGDILKVRGSLGTIQSRTDASNLVISAWYGGVPINGSAITVLRGILKASEVSDSLGLQVSLYTEDSREESEKTAVIESINLRPASDSLGIATGGEGEYSVTLNGDNIRVLAVAYPPSSWV